MDVGPHHDESSRTSSTARVCNCVKVCQSTNFCVFVWSVATAALREADPGPAELRRPDGRLQAVYSGMTCVGTAQLLQLAEVMPACRRRSQRPVPPFFCRFPAVMQLPVCDALRIHYICAGLARRAGEVLRGLRCRIRPSFPSLALGGVDRPPAPHELSDNPSSSFACPSFSSRPACVCLNVRAVK